MRAVKKGMWVTFEGKTGVAHVGTYRDKAGNQIDVEEFHQVNAKGETELVVAAPFSNLKQAKYKDIPKSRVAHLPAEHAKKRFGYQ